MRISKKYRKISDGYLYFVSGLDTIDTSEEAREQMYSYETHGHPVVKYNLRNDDGLYNAYAVGKHWMDVTMAMWREDLKSGILSKNELYSDEDIPEFVKQIVERL